MRKRLSDKFIAQCHGKTPYDTKAKAIERIEHQMGNRFRHKERKNGYHHTKLEPYRCRYCGHWHVGSGTNWSAIKRHQYERRVAKSIDHDLERL